MTKTLVGTAIGCMLANFLIACFTHEWSVAFDRSYFQGVAVATVAFNRWYW